MLLQNKFGWLDMKKIILTSTLLLYIFIDIQIVYAKEQTNIDHRIFETISSFSMTGAGAIPAAMGDTYLAVSDDGTAVTWNPAGLIVVGQTELSIAGVYFHRIENLNFSIDKQANGNQTTKQLNLRYVGITQPAKALGHYMWFSLFYQKMFDFNRKWNFDLTRENDTTKLFSKCDYQSEGGISVLGLGYTIRAKSKHLAFGMTCNIMNDDFTGNAWEQKTYQQDVGYYKDIHTDFISQFCQADKYSFKGFNFTFGLMFREIYQWPLNIGLIVKTPYKADVTKDRSIDHWKKTSSTYTIKMPASYGIGFSYRFSDEFICAFDIYRTSWDHFVEENSLDVQTSPITGKPVSQTQTKPTHQLRMGIEYNYKRNDRVTPLYLGLFYDPLPSEKNPDDCWGITLGSGMMYSDLFTINLAYQYRFGNNINQSVLKHWGFSQDINEHTFHLSMVMDLSKLSKTKGPY